MVDSVITKQELIDAQKDAQTLEDVVNGEAGQLVTSRLGRQYYALATYPNLSVYSRDEINYRLSLKANSDDVYDKSETYAKNEVDNSIANLSAEIDGFTSSLGAELLTKASIIYVDSAVGAISTDASKQYATLALATSDIANIPINKNVFISEAANGGYWYKATAGATSLTKSAYDPLMQSKEYTDVQIENIGISSNYDSSISVAIVDKEGRRTWLEADDAGKPTDYSSSLVVEKTLPTILSEIGIEQIPSTDLSVAIVDENYRRTWLEADQTGEPTDYTMEVFKKKLDVVTTVENIVCWGDSMTAGAGGDGRSYPLILGELLTAAGSTAKVVNAGVGGETSATITARQGGNPFIIKIDANTLPADTSPVRVTLLPIGGKTVTPLLQGSSSFDGYFNGILCTLKLVQPNGASSSWNAANYYTLQRKTAGTALTIDRPHPFYLEISKPYWGDIHIIWIGQNNLADGAARHIADAKAMIQKMTAQNKKYIVIPRPFNSVEAYDKAQKDAFDAEFFAAFGRRCVLIRQYLVEYGLADAGLTATSQDLIDIANGTVPEQLRVDVVHWKSAAYQILATQVFNRIKELEYI